MSQPFLSAYRNRLCRQGWGPYKGLLVPSSGLVVVQMMQQVISTTLTLTLTPTLTLTLPCPFA